MPAPVFPTAVIAGGPPSTLALVGTAAAVAVFVFFVTSRNWKLFIIGVAFATYEIFWLSFDPPNPHPEVLPQHRDPLTTIEYFFAVAISVIMIVVASLSGAYRGWIRDSSGHDCGVSSDRPGFIPIVGRLLPLEFLLLLISGFVGAMGVAALAFSYAFFQMAGPPESGSGAAVQGFIRGLGGYFIEGGLALAAIGGAAFVAILVQAVKRIRGRAAQPFDPGNA